MRTTTDEDGSGAPLDRDAAEALVRNGDLPVAVGDPCRASAPRSAHARLRLGGPPIAAAGGRLRSDRAAAWSAACCRKSTMTAAPDLMMQGRPAAVRKVRRADDAAAARRRGRLAAAAGSRRQGSQRPAAGGAAMGISFEIDGRHAHDEAARFARLVLRRRHRRDVPALLDGRERGRPLLDEVESGTLERLLSTKLGMIGILLGKWVLLMLVGFAQLCVMFLWGALVFGLPLFSHVPGFVVMTVVTAAAAAALACARDACAARAASSRASRRSSS